MSILVCIGRALASAALLAAGAADSAAAQPARGLLLVGIDGLRPDYVLEADRYGLRIPNLRRFVREGVYATAVQGVLPTVTYPSFTSVLTGMAPARHGIVANTTFDPQGVNQGGWYWYTEDVRVPTLWDAARSAGRRTANVHWPVSVGASVDLNLPQIWRTGTPDDRKLLRALASPGLVTRLEALVGIPYADGIDESLEGDENRARFAEALLRTGRPDFMTAYFTSLDHEQHVRGPFTPEVFAVLERIDAILGRLEEAARAVWGEGAVVAVVSDHGFRSTRHEVHLGVALREAGLLAVQGDRVSGWEAAFWPSGSTAALILREPSNAVTRERVKALLDRLAADPASGVQRILEPSEIAAMGGFPQAAFVVALAPGYQVGHRLEGPLVAERGVGGMHGFPPDDPEMASSFLVAGSGVAPGRNLGVISILDIAPTLAAHVGLSLPEAEGRRHSLR